MTVELRLTETPDGIDDETAHRARRTVAQMAARCGATAADLEETLAMLGLGKDSPTDWRYTAEGKRVRPCNMRPQERRQDASGGGVDRRHPPDPSEGAAAS